MGHLRTRPAREALPPHPRRPPPACRRNRNLAPLLRERLKNVVRPMKRSLRSWLWRVPLDQEVDEEIAFHVEMRTRELVDRGVDPRAAREEALRRFGNLARTRHTLVDLGRKRDREMRVTQWIDAFKADVRF